MPEKTDFCSAIKDMSCLETLRSLYTLFISILHWFTLALGVCALTPASPFVDLNTGVGAILIIVGIHGIYRDGFASSSHENNIIIDVLLLIVAAFLIAYIITVTASIKGEECVPTACPTCAACPVAHHQDCPSCPGCSVTCPDCPSCSISVTCPDCPGSVICPDCPSCSVCPACPDCPACPKLNEEDLQRLLLSKAKALATKVHILLGLDEIDEL